MLSLEDVLTGTVTVFELTGAIGFPFGGVPTTVAVFTIEPASRSAWVTVWFPVQIVFASGANDEVTQLMPVAFGSLTAIAVMVTLPVLVTVKV